MAPPLAFVVNKKRRNVSIRIASSRSNYLPIKETSNQSKTRQFLVRTAGFWKACAHVQTDQKVHLSSYTFLRIHQLLLRGETTNRGDSNEVPQCIVKWKSNKIVTNLRPFLINRNHAKINMRHYVIFLTPQNFDTADI